MEDADQFVENMAFSSSVNVVVRKESHAPSLYKDVIIVAPETGLLFVSTYTIVS